MLAFVADDAVLVSVCVFVRARLRACVRACVICFDDDTGLTAVRVDRIH